MKREKSLRRRSHPQTMMMMMMMMGKKNISLSRFAFLFWSKSSNASSSLLLALPFGKRREREREGLFSTSTFFHHTKGLKASRVGKVSVRSNRKGEEDDRQTRDDEDAFFFFKTLNNSGAFFCFFVLCLPLLGVDPTHTTTNAAFLPLRKTHMSSVQVRIPNNNNNNNNASSFLRKSFSTTRDFVLLTRLRGVSFFSLSLS